MSVLQYQAAQLHTASPLTVELMIFSRVTNALKRLNEESSGDSPRNPVANFRRHVRLCDAIHQNSRLWIALLDDLNSPANGLSRELKGCLAKLAATVFRHARRVLAGESGPQLLIEINDAVIAGLTQARAMAGEIKSAEPEVQYARRQA